MLRQSFFLCRDRVFPRGSIFPIVIEYLCRDRVGQGLDFSCLNRVFLCRDRAFPRVGFVVGTEVFKSRQSWPGREVFLS